MAMLKIRDENGVVREVLALRGPKGEDGGVVYITMTRNGSSYTPDMAYADAEAAILAGKNVVAKYTNSDGVSIFAPVTTFMEGNGILFGAVTYILGELKYQNIIFTPEGTAYITAISLEKGAQ